MGLFAAYSDLEPLLLSRKQAIKMGKKTCSLQFALPAWHSAGCSGTGPSGYPIRKRSVRRGCRRELGVARQIGHAAAPPIPPDLPRPQFRGGEQTLESIPAPSLWRSCNNPGDDLSLPHLSSFSLEAVCFFLSVEMSSHEQS